MREGIVREMRDVNKVSIISALVGKAKIKFKSWRYPCRVAQPK